VRLSVVIPVLNEAPLLAAFLRHLRERAPGVELIVVDGGSRDGSALSNQRPIWSPEPGAVLPAHCLSS